MCVSARWSFVLLLAASLRFGDTQDESLPPSLVDLVMSSPISSMQDLQNLLDVESVEEDEDEVHSNSTHKRLPRSLAGVQVAQQAVCKVRTEVMEVTRGMLDRRNANFLLWPLCVEVQRCSGCCNTRTQQCVPVATEMRHLQMTKIQFINRQPVYEKVIIPVEDHVTCSCQSRSAGPAPRAKATPVPPPPRLPPKAAPPRIQSKEELHRHDDLKQNQRFHLEDRETQDAQWQSKYTVSHTQGVPAHTLTHSQGYRPSPVQHVHTHTPAGPSYVSVEDISTRRTTLGVPPMQSDTTQHFTVQDDAKEHHTTLRDVVEEHHSRPEKVPEHPTHSGDGNVKAPVQHRFHLQQDGASHHSQSEVTLQHSGQLEAPVVRYSHVEVIGQSSGQTKQPGHHSGQSATPSFHHSQSKAANRHHSQSKHHHEGRAEETEQSQSRSHHVHHHHHHLHPTQASSPPQSRTTAVMKAPPTMPPAPQTPPPPIPQRKRRRKHRRRISKSAMRTMIMVMS